MSWVATGGPDTKQCGPVSVFSVTVSSAGKTQGVVSEMVRLWSKTEGFGATVVRADGVWNGELENAVRIETQCSERALVNLLGRLRRLYMFKMVHVERSTRDVVWYDLGA